MKKNCVLITAFLLITGLLVVSCPSDAIPPEGVLVQGNITMVDGIYDEEFDNVTIEKGKNYLVTIDIKEVDFTLYGCHFQAQLFYKDAGGSLFLMAGSQNAMPQNIAVKGKKYRITLTAGDYGTGPEAEDTPAKQEAGGYQIPAENITETPAGAVQIIRLTAKTPQWYSFGKRNQPNNGNAPDSWPDFNYYDPGNESGIDGEITVALKRSTLPEAGPEIILSKGDSLTTLEFEDGKGNIDKEEFAKLQEAAKTEGAVLRVWCKVRKLVASGGSGSNDTYSAGGGTPQPGWGIGSFGNPDLAKVRGQEQDVPIRIPEIYKGQSVGAQPNGFTWVTDILVDDLLAVAHEDGWIFVNINNGGAVEKMQVFTPGQELPQEILDLLEYKELLELLKEIGLDAIREMFGL
jgi:hypothetical protein